MTDDLNKPKQNQNRDIMNIEWDKYIILYILWYYMIFYYFILYHIISNIYIYITLHDITCMSIIKSFKQQSDMYVFGHINEEHMMINIDKPSIFGVPYFQTNPCPAVHTVMNWDHPKRGGRRKMPRSVKYIYIYI